MSKEERKFVSRYTRPIKFVSSSSSSSDDLPPEKNKKLKVSSGDQVASLYRSITQSTPTPADTSNTWYCPHCELYIKEDYKQHCQGTAHLVSTGDTTFVDLLTLNGSNVGFKMLQSQGWQYEDGLGADSQGRRHPIATVLKQDRLGVGHKETSKKAVTHRYEEIEKRAIQRHLLLKNKDPGKEIAKKAKAESKERVALLNYFKN